MGPPSRPFEDWPQHRLVHCHALHPTLSLSTAWSGQEQLTGNDVFSGHAIQRISISPVSVEVYDSEIIPDSMQSQVNSGAVQVYQYDYGKSFLQVKRRLTALEKQHRDTLRQQPSAAASALWWHGMGALGTVTLRGKLMQNLEPLIFNSKLRQELFILCLALPKQKIMIPLHHVAPYIPSCESLRLGATSPAFSFGAVCSCMATPSTRTHMDSESFCQDNMRQTTIASF